MGWHAASTRQFIAMVATRTRRSNACSLFGHGAFRPLAAASAAVACALILQLAAAAPIPVAALNARLDLPPGWQVIEDAGARGCALAAPDGSRVDIVAWQLSSPKPTAEAAAAEHIILLERSCRFRETSRRPAKGPLGQPALAVEGLARADGAVWTGYFVAFVTGDGRACVVGSFVPGADRYDLARELVARVVHRLRPPPRPAPVLAFLPAPLQPRTGGPAAARSAAEKLAAPLVGQPPQLIRFVAATRVLAYCRAPVIASVAGLRRGPTPAAAPAAVRLASLPGRPSHLAPAVLAYCPPGTLRAEVASRPLPPSQAGRGPSATSSELARTAAPAGVATLALRPATAPSMPAVAAATAPPTGPQPSETAGLKLAAAAPEAVSPTRPSSQAGLVSAVAAPQPPRGSASALASRPSRPPAGGTSPALASTPPAVPASATPASLTTAPPLAGRPAAALALPSRRPPTPPVMVASRPTPSAGTSGAPLEPSGSIAAGSAAAPATSRPARPPVLAAAHPSVSVPGVVGSPASVGPAAAPAPRRPGATVSTRPGLVAGRIRDIETGSLSVRVPLGWVVTAHVYEGPAGPCIEVRGVSADDPAARFHWVQPARPAYRDYSQLLRALGYREWQKYTDQATGSTYTVVRLREPRRYLEDVVLPQGDGGLTGWEILDARPSDSAAALLYRGRGAIVHLLGYTAAGSRECWFAVATGHLAGQPVHVWAGAWLGCYGRPGDRKALSALAAVIKSASVSRAGPAADALSELIQAAASAVDDLLAAAAGG